MIPKIQKDENNGGELRGKGLPSSPQYRKSKGKEPENKESPSIPSIPSQKKVAQSQHVEQLCFRHYYLNHYVNTAPYQLRDGSCMCCYTHKTNSADFYTVTNGIIDKFLCPLLLPSTTTHATGVICTKHFVRNMELYEIYKKSHDIRLKCGAFMFPKNEKGEDAYFVGGDGKYLGLADGVGGWAQYNVDPRQFPEKLMEEVHSVFREGYSNDLQELLGTAFESSKHVTGSSTVVMAMLDKNDTLRTLNLGDSGFRVIRDHQILYATKEQQHAPNKPFQLGTSCEDTPESGVVEHMKLRAGDMIVFGSDGLFDNLFDDQIIETIKNSAHVDLNKLSQEIANAAHKVSIDKHAFSPYAAWVRSLGNPDWDEVVGGKKDDITVIVARVEQYRAPSNDLSLSHFQSTAMSFSIDSPSLQALFSQIKWDTPGIANMRSISDLEGIRDRLSQSEGMPRAYKPDPKSPDEVSLSSSPKPIAGLHHIRSRRSASANGYFGDDPTRPNPSGEHPLAKSTGKPDSPPVRPNLLRGNRSMRSQSVRELSHSKLLSQATEQLNVKDVKTLTNISANTHNHTHGSGSEGGSLLRGNINKIFRASTASSVSSVVVSATAPPSSPFIQANPLIHAQSDPSLSSMPNFSPQASYKIPPNPSHLSLSVGNDPAPRRVTPQLSQYNTNCDNLSKSSSTASFSSSKSGSELVAAKPTWKASGSEQDYFEYMVAMREFEVFVNLHRNTRITILPYFL